MPASHYKEFERVNTWIFDLDNTLYPATNALFSQIDIKMGDFISKYLNMSIHQAKELQKHYYHTYGTTLRGLMVEHAMDPYAFLDHVHDIDHSVIEPDAFLAESLGALPGRKYIFTNGSRRHAENVSNRLGISHVFEDMFDIVAADFIPKPDARPYRQFLTATGATSTASAMFEDLARNLEVPHGLGMCTVLVSNGNNRTAGANGETDAGEAAHIDHRTDDLPVFLADMLAALNTR